MGLRLPARGLILLVARGTTHPAVRGPMVLAALGLTLRAARIVSLLTGMVQAGNVNLSGNRLGIGMYINPALVACLFCSKHVNTSKV